MIRDKKGNLVPLVIFDLDGTLCDITHRRHFVEGEKQDWQSFYKECVNDVPNTRVISIANAFRRSGHEVWIFSGRSNEVKLETMLWLAKNGMGAVDFIAMRSEGDYTPDHELKKKWYEDMHEEDKSRLLCVFDDRDRLVKMWRSLGVTCCQVAEGNF